VSNRRATKSYGGARLQTATCLDVTCLLHERALLELARERQAREAGDEQARQASITHARRIALELVASIDLTKGELAESLHRLYCFAAARISPLAEPEDLEVAGDVLRELGQAYGELRTTGVDAPRAVLANL